jgi:hypothetical protein
VTTVWFWPHLWLSARWLPVRAKRRSIEALLTNAVPPAGYEPYRGLDAQDVLAAVRATTARPWRMRGRRCLREGLLGFRFLRLAGFAPVLHFGAERGSASTDHLQAHCWITLEGRCVLNPPSEKMRTLFRWDGEKVIGTVDA